MRKSSSSTLAGVAAKKKNDNSKISLIDKKKKKKPTTPIENSGIVPQQTSPDLIGMFQAGTLDSGRPLDYKTRSIFENALGYDFSDVRIHDGDRAEQSASAISADAYTFGQDIFFAEGMYRPDTISGKLLLAHELIHTVQQRKLARGDAIAAASSSSQHAPFSVKITDVHDHLELEARRISEHLVLRDGGLPLDTISVANVRGGKIISRQISRLAASAATHSSPHGGGPWDMEKVSFVVETIIRSLEEDPSDKAGKVRNQLAGLNESLRQLVLDRLRNQLRADQLEFVHQQLMLLPAIPTEEEQEIQHREGETRASAATTATTTARSQEITLKEHEKEENLEEEGKEEEKEERDDQEEEQQKKLEKEKEKVLGPPLHERLQPSSADLIKEPSENGEEEIADTPELRKGAMVEGEEEGDGQRRRAVEGQAVVVQPALTRGGAAAGPAATTTAPPSAAIPESPVAKAEEAVPADQGEVAAPSIHDEEGGGGEEEEEEWKRPPVVVEEVEAESKDQATIPEAPSLPSEQFIEPIRQEPSRIAEGSILEEAAVPEPSREPILPDVTAIKEDETAAAAAAEVGGVSSSPPPPESLADVEQANVPEGSATKENEAATASTASSQGQETQLITEDEKSAFGFSSGTAGLEDAADAGIGAGAGGAGGGGFGGGGAVPIEELPASPPVPDVSQLEPSAALTSISGLPPAQMLTAMSGVTSSVSNTVGQKRSQLASEPPQIERPSGLRPGDPALEEEIPISSIVQARRRVNRVPRGESVSTPQPRPMAEMPPAPVENISLPAIGQAGGGGGGEQEGQMSAEDASRVRAAVDDLPTTDPALNVTAGLAPKVQLQGDADPENVNRQRSELDMQASDSLALGRQDAVEPMGEDEVYPKVPQETLTAQIPRGAGPAEAAGGGGGGKGGAAVGGAAVMESPSTLQGGREPGAANGTTTDAVSIIAQEQRGSEINSSIGKANSEIMIKEQEHSEQVTEANEASKQEIDQLVADSATEQLDERNSARRKVAETRGQWLSEQDGVIDKSRQDTDAAGVKGRTELSTEQARANSEASTHIQDGNKTVASERRQAEQKAATERAKAKSETSSKGFFGWLASKAKRFFNAIKNAIKSAFDRARKAVKAAIEKAKQLATAAIEAARRTIVNIIQKVGDALIAIGDVVLAAFPEMRQRFRTAIQTRVRNAVNKVNQLAEELKVGVQKALDALGAALDAALGLLERGLLAAVDVVDRVVQGAIKFAQAVVDAFLAFAALIADIRPNPGQWIRNLKAGAIDGVENHLWRELKAAVMEWFSQKIEQVLGLGAAVWDMLRKGEISLSMVAKMAWEGIKSALPRILIRLVIEKLVSMIIPAVGAIMVIIETIQAAWGAISRIIQAFQKFFAFLKAVKGGNAGRPFAVAVAAGAIAVIDFVSNWLIARLMRPLRGVAGKLRAQAQRIGQRLKGVGRAARRGIVRVGRALRTTGKRLGTIGRKARVAFRRTRVGRSISGMRARRRSQGGKRRETAQQKLDRVTSIIGPKLNSTLRRGIRGIRLRALLAMWKVRYRLSQLSIRGDKSFDIVAKVNPGKVVIQGVTFDKVELLQYVAEVAQEIYTHEKTQRGAKEIQKHSMTASARHLEPFSLPLPEYTTVQHEHSMAAFARYLRESPHQGLGRIERITFKGDVPSDILRQQSIYKIKRKPEYEREDPQWISKLAAIIKSGSKEKRLNKGETYEDYIKSLRKMGSNKEISDALHMWTTERRVPPGFEQHRDAIAHISAVMLGAEGARNISALVHAPMALDLMAGIGVTKALRMLPMKAEKAMEQSRELDWLTAYKTVSPEVKAEYDRAVREGRLRPEESPEAMARVERAKAKAMLEREVKLIKMWLNSLDLKLSGSSNEEKKREIKQAIRERLLKFYKLDSAELLAK